MATTSLNIRTDQEVKASADAIFAELGISMTTAINIFLRQVIRENGLPFEMKLTPNQTTAAAIEEVRRIAYDPNAKGYRDMDALRAALDV